MESSNLKSDNISQTISAKIIDLLSDLHHCSPNQSTSPNSQYQLSTFPYSPAQRGLHSIFQKNLPQDFSVCILECIEGCCPILREKWKFHWDPSDTSEITEPNQYSEISRTLRSISLAISVISTFDFLNLRLQLAATAAEDVQWDLSLQKTDIKSFPRRPFSLQNVSGTLRISAEYTEIHVKPRIVSQNLGSRPRLVSLDYGEESRDKGKLNFSFISTEPSPKEPYRKNTGGKLLELIASESFCEEQEIGFKMIESELNPERDSAEENFGHNSFDMEFEENYSEYNDDAHITSYIQQCKTALNLKIFTTATLNCNELVQEWKSSSSNNIML